MAPKKDEKHAPKIKIKAGGKAKVKIIVFPPKVKANKEETTELEAADDKVTGFSSLVMYSEDLIYLVEGCFGNKKQPLTKQIRSSEYHSFRVLQS